MARYAVISDDLTGAGDTGVQFAVAGLPTALDVGEAQEHLDAEVLVVTTDSRSQKPEVAAEWVGSAVRRLLDAGVEQLYKKIDSTCRGNLATEIAAVLERLGPDTLAVVCPAFPPAGRVVVGGHLLVGNEPVHRTPIGVDPITPVRSSRIAELLAAEFPEVAHVDLGVVSEGHEAIGEALARLPGEVQAVVVDAMSDADLHEIATALTASERAVLPVGSAGLARGLAPLWAQRAAVQGPDRSVTLVVVGSLHEHSRRQAAQLQEAHNWPLLEIDVDAALAEPASWERQLEGLRRDAERLGAHAPGIVLTTPASRHQLDRTRELGKEKGLPITEVADTIARRLAEAARDLCQLLDPNGLVLTGGDIARATMRALGAGGVELTSEVQPGMPAGRLLGGPAAGLPIVTKAGGFGGDDALLMAARHLRHMHQDDVRTRNA